MGAFAENRFLLKELTQSGFAAVLPIKKGTFGLCYSSLGYKLYRESQLSLSYGIVDFSDLEVAYTDRANDLGLSVEHVA